VSDPDRPLDADELTRLRWAMRLATDLSLSVERLRKLGYSDRSILAGFEQVRPRGNSLDDGAVHNPPLLQRKPPGLRRIHEGRLDLYTLDDFLGSQECARIVALIGHHLQPSIVSYRPTTSRSAPARRPSCVTCAARSR
jgi:hypothetical protein